MPGDANLDLVVDVNDLGLLAGNWNIDTGRLFTNADFTGDGDVDVSDLAGLGSHYDQNWQTLFIFADLNSDYAVDEEDAAILVPNGQAGDWADGDLNGDGFVTQADMDVLEGMLGVSLRVVA